MSISNILLYTIPGIFIIICFIILFLIFSALLTLWIYFLMKKFGFFDDFVDKYTLKKCCFKEGGDK